MKNDRARLTMLVLGALTLAGCGDQDPLASQPDYIRDATPGFQKPAPPVASKETMIISSNATHFFFTETVESQVVITGRILLDNYESELTIDNLDDFDGASFDPATGIFSWTPPRGFVSGGESTRTTYVRVRMNGRQTQSNFTATRTEDFPMTVTRMDRQPTIVKETGFPAGVVREGGSLQLTLYVKDEDAANQPGRKPRIFIQAPINSKSDLSPYVRSSNEDNPTQDFSDPTLWKFDLTVNLRDADVTKDSGDFYFRVTAVSRFGKMSPAKEYRVAVSTKVQQPILSSDRFEATAGVDLSQDIIVMDPRQEGLVTVEIMSLLPKGLSLKCEQQATRRWMNVCRANWKLAPLPAPSADGAGTETSVRIRAINSSPVALDLHTAYRDYTLTFKVVAQ